MLSPFSVLVWYMCKYKNFNIYSLILHFRSECKSLTCTNEIETKVRVHWKNSHYVVLFSKSTPMCMWIKELFSTLYHYYSWARHSVKGEDHWLKIYYFGCLERFVQKCKMSLLGVVFHFSLVVDDDGSNFTERSFLGIVH